MQALQYGGSPTLIYNLGRAHEEKGEAVTAIGFFRQYAALTTISAKDRDEALARAERLDKQRTASGVLVLSGLPPGAEVQVDGVRVPVSPAGEVAVSPGRHFVEATLAGAPPFRQPVDVAPGSRVALAVTLVPAPVVEVPLPVTPTPLPTPEPPVTIVERRSSALRTSGWVTMGLGLAFLGAGATFHVLASSEWSEVDDAASNDVVSGVTMQEASDREASGNRFSDVAVAGYALGGAAVAAGLVLLLIPDGSSAAVAPLPGGGGLVVVGGGF